MRIPIVVVAYNRTRSLSRLLGSLEKANYPHQDIDLIISIDKAGNNQDVLNLANEFQWKQGVKRVVYQEINLGLRKHIIKCGGLSMEYGAVIVLEDDLFVSPNFYVFAEQALKFSQRELSIGGISLYNHQLNVHSRDNFSALEDGYDNWYFQFASSWGQAWTKEQWLGFMHWYDNDPQIDNNQNVPAYVRSWSPKSWLKYHIAYLIEKNLYFLYPKISFTTNFSDAGTHVGQDSTIYQVPLDYGKEREFNFSKPRDSFSVYNSFYENVNLYKAIGLGQEELMIDLYGYRPLSGRKYILTPKILDFEILRSYGKSLKPHEANILSEIEGKEIFLYDTTTNRKNENRPNFERKVSYNFKQIPFGITKKLFVIQSVSKVKRLFDRIFKK